jgi:hypothetical protein
MRHWKPIAFFAGGLLVAALVLGFSAQGIPWKGSVSQENGVMVVRNPKEPLYDGKVITLNRELAIGGAAAAENAVIASARSLAVDEAENIYVLDEKDFAVKVFDKNGAFLRRFAQRGKGPGDLDKPSRISIDRSKNALMIVNGTLGLSFFSFDGTFLKNFAAEEAKRAQYARADSIGRVVLNSIRTQDIDHRWDVLSKFESESGPPIEVKNTTLGSPYDFLMPLVYWDLDEKDHIYYGYPKAYEIEIFDPQNKIIKRILKDYDPVEPGAEVKAQIAQTMKLMTPSLASKTFVSKYHSAFINFIVDEQGRLFVSSWEKVGKDYVYDVFDPEGRFIAKFTLPFRPVLFKKGRLYCIEEDADGYQAVTRYSLNWLKK